MLGFRGSKFLRAAGACRRWRSATRAPMSTLVYVDHDNVNLNEGSRACITAAQSLNKDVVVLVAGKGCKGVAEEAAGVNGVSKVIHVENDGLEHQLAEDVSQAILKLQGTNSFTNIMGSATANGKNVMPRVAAALDVAIISDVIKIPSEDTFVRPIYAGDAIATFQSSDAIKVLTVRNTAFEKAENSESKVSIDEASVDVAGLSKWIRDEVVKSERPDLATAKNVVSGGRGVGSQEDFVIINDLADKLGAAVGASRAAVDLGYASNDMQVGQTGKVVAPNLYVAVGISGAIQHLAGMKDSKTIVSINKDADAPIFQVSDYGLVGDLFKAVPELNEKLSAK